MSVLEFISSLKWPIVVLVALLVVARGFKRNPNMGRWFRNWLDTRDVRGKIGPTEFEATASGARAAVELATASDEELASIAAREPSPPGEAASPSQGDVTALRREAVEEVMRQAAAWGWGVSRVGFVELPQWRVDWNEQGEPTIRTAASFKDVTARLLNQLLESKVAPQTNAERLLADLQRRRNEAAHDADQETEG